MYIYPILAISSSHIFHKSKSSRHIFASSDRTNEGWELSKSLRQVALKDRISLGAISSKIIAIKSTLSEHILTAGGRHHGGDDDL